MKTTRSRPLAAVMAALLAAALTAVALAEGVRTKETAILYSGLSEKSPPIAIFEKGYPLRSISRINQWEKVETADRTVGWIRSEHLEPSRIAVVSVASAQIRVAPQPDAQVTFLADEGVLLEVLADEPGEWLEVRHEDGDSGHVLKSEVWRNERRSP